MSGLGFNKVAGAVLATGLAVLGLREISRIVYQQEAPERAGYRIEAAEAALASTGAAAPELAPDWGTVLAAADTSAGAASSRKCVSCHTFENGGANGIGPNLWAVVNRAVAGVAGYDYSPAMRAHAGEAPSWTYDELDGFLRAPSRHVAGTKMTFVGVRQQAERINLIAYLRTVAAAPAPIPASDPTRLAGASGPGASATVPSTGAGDTAAGTAAAEQNPAGEGTSAQAAGQPTTPQPTPPPQPGGGPNNQAPTSGAAQAPNSITNRNPGGDPGRR